MTASIIQQPSPRLDDSLFVLHAWVLRPGSDLAQTPRFTEDVWPLRDAIVQQQQSSCIVDFRVLPEFYRQVTKELVYAMLSGPLPPGETRRSIGTIHSGFNHFARFFAWLNGRDLAADLDPPTLAALTSADLQDYQRHLALVLPSPERQRAARAFVRYFWRYRQVLATDRLVLDPQDVDGWGGGPHRRPTENTTERHIRVRARPVAGMVHAVC